MQRRGKCFYPMHLTYKPFAQKSITSEENVYPPTPSKCSHNAHKVSLTGPKLDDLELPLVAGLLAVMGLNVAGLTVDGLKPWRLFSSSNSIGLGSLPCNSYAKLMPSICAVFAAFLSDAILLTAEK